MRSYYYFFSFFVSFINAMDISEIENTPLSYNADYVESMKRIVDRDLSNGVINFDYTPVQQIYYNKLCAKKSGSLDGEPAIFWEDSIKEYRVSKKNKIEKAFILAAVGLKQNAASDLFVRKCNEYAYDLANRLLHGEVIDNFWNGTLYFNATDPQEPLLVYKRKDKQRVYVNLESENTGDSSPRIGVNNNNNEKKYGTEKISLLDTIKPHDPIHSSLKNCSKIIYAMYKESRLRQQLSETERLLNENRERGLISERERDGACARIKELERSLQSVQNHHKNEQYHLKKRNYMFYGLGLTCGIALTSFLYTVSNKLFFISFLKQ